MHVHPKRIKHKPDMEKINRMYICPECQQSKLLPLRPLCGSNEHQATNEQLEKSIFDQILWEE